MKNIKNMMNNMDGVKYFKNTSWLLGEKLIRLLLGVLVGIWVARYLGPEQFGLYSYAISFVGVFIVISSLGLDSIVVRELVNDEKNKNYILGSAFVLKVFGSILSLLLLWGAMFLLAEDAEENKYIFIIASSTIFQSFNVIDFYFQSKVLGKYVAFSNLCSLVVSSFIKVFLILSNAPLIDFVYVVLFDSFVLSAGYVFFYIKNKLDIFAWAFRFKIALSLLKDSWLLIVSGAVSSVYMQIDQVMIKHMLSNVDVGQYAAAVRLSEVWYLFPVIISTSLFPAIITARNARGGRYIYKLQLLYDFMVWFAIAIACFITFTGEWLMTFLYGKEYEVAGAVLILHIWASIFIFLGVASGKWYILEGLQKHVLYKALAGAAINVSLNFILIPQYGIFGAAIATISSLIVADFLYNIFFKKTRITFFLMVNAFLFPLRALGVRFYASTHGE